MKTKFFVLYLLLVNIYCSTVPTLAQTAQCASKSPSKKKDCNDIYDDDLQKAGYHCCYVYQKYKNEISGQKEFKTCTPIDKEYYDSIGDNWDTIKKTAEDAAKQLGNELKKYKIQCKSSFLKIGLIGLVTALLF